MHMSPNITSILLIYTGGTIGMIENPETGALENFNLEQLKKHVPELQNFTFHIDTYQFDPPMDSSDMDPEAWRKLVHIISDHYDRYTGLLNPSNIKLRADAVYAIVSVPCRITKPVYLS